ncbi:MAG: hypothetical protein ACI8R4_004405, partial [Paracoccaceae bacterium]
SSVLTHASAAQGQKRLISKRNQLILASSGMPLGECRFKKVSTIALSKQFPFPLIETSKVCFFRRF